MAHAAAPTRSNVLGHIYPAYASYKAVLSGAASEHTQWLSYWCGSGHRRGIRTRPDAAPHPAVNLLCRVVTAVFTLFESVADRVISWLPLYWEAKLAFIVWLTLYNGAATIYTKLIHK